MDKIEEIRKKITEINLVISRVPLETKKNFMDLANAEFSGDYGMSLKWCFEQAVEYQKMKILFFENIDNKLNHILEVIPSEPGKETITLLSGKKIIKRRKNG